MTGSDTLCTLTFSTTSGGVESIVATVCSGAVATGLCEDTRYLVDIEGAAPSRLFFDDVELDETADGRFAWTPNFFAGRATAVAVEPLGREHTFLVDVSPTPHKLGAEQFDAMLAEIRGFDTTLLMGTSAASMDFGREGRPGKFELLIQLARLRQHGPAFLHAVRELSRAPQRFLRPASQALPLSRIRRLHPSSVRDRRLVALAVGYLVDDESLESLQLLSQSPILTVDTPANRTLMALLRRFRAVVGTLADKTEALSLGGSPEDQGQRKERRLESLNLMGTAANRLLESYPFTEVAKAEATAAGFTHIAAHPSYSRAYRKGTEALRVNVEGPKLEDLLPVSPSWGVYETWCFIHLVKIVGTLITQSLQPCQSSAALADFAMVGTLEGGHRLELLFQATFPSEAPNNGKCAWSISRERRPDIVLIVTQETGRRFLVFDSKYRSGRENVLDAMTSAHVYHDSLRIDGKRPELCVLLLPGPAAVPSLESTPFRTAHRVGALSEFSLGAQGILRCADLLRSWLVEAVD